MPNFDEAIRATEEMFADEQANTEEMPPTEDVPVETEENVPPTEEVSVEEPTDPVVAETEATLNDAVQTAEVAAQAVQERELQMQQLMADMEALRAQNQQMQGTIDELSRRNEEHLIEEGMLPPELDIDGLAFADKDTQKAEMAKFVESLSAYNRKQMMAELAPTLEFAKKGMQQEEKSEVINALSQVPELVGITDMLPQLDRIIASNRWLQSDDMSMDEKYINAYAIARGVNAINTPPEEPKELTSEELMELYDKNPTFQELVEKKRLDAIKQSQQVPPFSASSGAVNAALNIKEKPKTLEEASEATRKMFGLG